MKKSRILSIILTLAMIVSLVPAVLVGASATDGVDGEVQVTPVIIDEDEAPAIYNVVVAAADENGSTVKADKTAAAGGETVTITSAAAEGNKLVNVAVIGSDGSAVTVTKAENGTYSFKMPYCTAYVTPSFAEGTETPTEPETPEDKDGYTDVNDADWFQPAVLYVTENKFMTGATATTFAPATELTRADTVDLIWKMAGSPKAKAAPEFTDVAEGDPSYDAIAWAAETGIVKGTDATTFAPDSKVTREQFCTITYAYVKTLGQGFTGTWAFQLEYTDKGEVSDWAYESIAWLSMKKVVSGTGDGAFAPELNVTKAEAAQISMNFGQLPADDTVPETPVADTPVAK